MIFGQLIELENNMRNSLLQNSYTEADPFIKNQKLSISLDQQYEML